ncbi:MAG: MobF family relaxase [Acidimicrobiales bacterium]|nr:MobF family relaxase [Acidimicrobiales bacterium]
MSIGKLAAGQQDYYLNAVAKGVEDYYAARGEVPGRWVGSGARDLGLVGRVADDDLHAVLSGLDPHTGVVVGANGRRVPGFDATFSAPKSVSLLYALGDDATSAAAIAAHEAAVDAALGYLERHAAVGRRGHGGTLQVDTTGFVGAAFRHRTSRLGDPQLHTHVLVANMVKGVDGRWGALDGRLLYVHKRTAGYLYQAQLRANLVRALGVEWAPVRKGMAEIAGIPHRVLRAFSRRRVEIELRMTERGAHTIEGAQVATLATRTTKQPARTYSQLRHEWQATAREVGYSPAGLNDIIEVGREPGSPRATRDELEDLLTEHDSHFDRRDVLQTIADAAPDGADITDIEMRADRFIASPSAVRLGPAKVGDTYSTPELLRIEQDLMASAERHADDAAGLATPDAIADAFAARPTLSDEQRGMVNRLATSGAGVDVVVGAAGAGKTFALDAARSAWQQSGHRVVGVALAARAAAELQAGSGIPSFTLDSLLQHCEHRRNGGLARNTVVVLDEAGMVGTRKLERLHRITRDAQAKLVLVGDPRQLPEIQAGGMFAALARRLGFTRLQANLRQRDEVERQALLELRRRDVGAAIARLTAHGHVTECTTAEDTRTALVQDWAAARDTGSHAVMFALRRSDVADLNARARNTLSEHGHLGAQELVVGDRAFAIGDNVIALRNNRRLGLINGTLGAVNAINAGELSLTIQTTDGQTRMVPSQYLRDGHLDHAYALSIHKAQGMTCDVALLLGDDRLYLEAGYTGLSRGRHQNRLYVVAAEPDIDHHGSPPYRDNDIVQALRRSTAQETATDIAHRARRTADIGISR